MGNKYKLTCGRQSTLLEAIISRSGFVEWWWDWNFALAPESPCCNQLWAGILGMRNQNLLTPRGSYLPHTHTLSLTQHVSVWWIRQFGCNLWIRFGILHNIIRYPCLMFTKFKIHPVKCSPEINNNFITLTWARVIARKFQSVPLGGSQRVIRHRNLIRCAMWFVLRVGGTPTPPARQIVSMSSDLCDHVWLFGITLIKVMNN